MLRDLRRTESSPSAGLEAALKLVGDRPGIVLLAERLKKGAPDLEALEKEIRVARP